MKAIWVLVLVCVLLPCWADDYSVLQEMDPNNHKYCAEYRDDWDDLPNSRSSQRDHIIAAVPFVGCPDVVANEEEFLDKVVFFLRGNCTFYEKALVAQDAGATGVVIVSTNNNRFAPGANSSQYELIHIPVIMVTHDDGMDLLEENTRTNGAVLVTMFAPDVGFDWAGIVMWFVAVGTVSFSAFYANPRPSMSGGESDPVMAVEGSRRSYGASASHPVSDQSPLLQRDDTNSGHGDDPQKNPEEEEDEFKVLSMRDAVMFVVMASVMLLMMYLLYDYMVYIMIGIFYLGSASSLLLWIMPVVDDIDTGYFEKQVHFLWCNAYATLKELVVIAFCFAITTWWVVERKEPYAWILLDILGLSFVSVLVRAIKLPSLKVTCVLLLLFFIYDVFFTFITPLFTDDGESVMESVASGGGSSSDSGSGDSEEDDDDDTEEMPFVLKLPAFQDPLRVCEKSYTLLGYGDIAIPGLFVSFCLEYDYRHRPLPRFPVYYIAVCIAYAVGLTITYIALYGMRIAQPALFYIVPCTLGTVAFLAHAKGELRAMWEGEDPRTEMSALSEDRTQIVLDGSDVEGGDEAANVEDLSRRNTFEF
eukprot:Rmarinus@m.27400